MRADPSTGPSDLKIGPSTGPSDLRVGPSTGPSDLRADPAAGPPEPENILNRREFLTAVGGGILISIFAPAFGQEGGERRRFRPQPARVTDFNAHLRIGANGRVTGYVGKIEMGQGAM